MPERQFRIREMRERARMSQQEVADALGIKKARFGDWERETTVLNLKDAIHLADLFGCSLDELAGHNVANKQSVTSEERDIIDTYRAAGSLGRRVILGTVRDVREDMEEDAREKKEVV